MPGAADFIQKSVHTLEAGHLAVWIRRALAVAVIAALSLLYLLNEFRGLSTSWGMDQAQIGRHIASGQGWSTNFFRPIAIGQLERHGKNVPQRIAKDTYNAPLPPLVDAVALRLVKSHWKMSPRDISYRGDLAVAAMSIAMFLLSVVVLYFTARRLFDDRLALLACALVLLCDSIWQYSLSGLPQTLLMLLLNATVYAIARAAEAQYRGGRVGVWLAAVGAGFGLLALTHALTIWIFVAALLVIGFFFRPRIWSAVIPLLIFAALYSPWLVRNFYLTGNPGGTAIYALFDDIKHSEAGQMRRMELDVAGAGPGLFRDKIVSGITSQFGRIFHYLGWNMVALMFIPALLHRFKKEETEFVRWIVLAMWIGGIAGMSLYGLAEEKGAAANQLHIVFAPLMTCFGLAFLFVQWSRLEIEFRLARIGFIALLFFLVSLPMIFTFVGRPSNRAQIQWPPYVPPYIAVLNDWLQPNEVTASDMPWAIAWYADRPSLWVPDTIKTFTEINDYNVLGRPLNSLYLTPISGTQNTLSDVLKGEYKDWSGVILRSVEVQKFPLKWATLLGMENECVFFSDHDRSKTPAAAP